MPQGRPVPTQDVPPMVRWEQTEMHPNRAPFRQTQNRVDELSDRFPAREGKNAVFERFSCKEKRSRPHIPSVSPPQGVENKRIPKHSPQGESTTQSADPARRLPWKASDRDSRIPRFFPSGKAEANRSPLSPHFDGRTRASLSQTERHKPARSPVQKGIGRSNGPCNAMHFFRFFAGYCANFTPRKKEFALQAPRGQNGPRAWTQSHHSQPPAAFTDPSFLEGAEPREPFCPSFVTLTHDTFQHSEGRQNARPCAKSAWSGSRSGRKKISKAHLRSLAAACHLPLVGKAHETAKFRGFPHKGKARDLKRPIDRSIGA